MLGRQWAHRMHRLGRRPLDVQGRVRAGPRARAKGGVPLGRVEVGMVRMARCEGKGQCRMGRRRPPQLGLHSHSGRGHGAGGAHVAAGRDEGGVVDVRVVERRWKCRWGGSGRRA